MTRSTPEWIGKTDDHVPPRSVKLRVFEAQNERCAECGVKFTVKPPEYDHIKALCNGGKNIESNIQALCNNCHKDKTKDDVALRLRIH